MNKSSAIEYFDIMNEDGTPTGTKLPRAEVHRLGLWHCCIHLWIVNIIGPTSIDVMLQRRAKDKESYPFHFDISSAGHLSSPEHEFLALIRELYEELGIYMTFIIDPTVFTEEKQCMLKNDLISRQLLFTDQDNAILQNALIAAHFVYENVKDQTAIVYNVSKPQTDLLHWQVNLSTIANPQYVTQNTLYFGGRQQQWNIVGENYIDNEFAYVFFLDAAMHTPSEQLTGDDQNHHVVTLLDNEVHSVVYINLDNYMALQRKLSHRIPELQQEDNTTCEHKIHATGSVENDAEDILNENWLVPITNLDSYHDTVFQHIRNFAQLKKCD